MLMAFEDNQLQLNLRINQEKNTKFLKNRLVGRSTYYKNHLQWELNTSLVG
jgi:hypothetical protein